MPLVGYWPLNESSGANEAKDYSGNENHGTINDGRDSTVPGASGVLGQNAYSFDGSNDYVDLSAPGVTGADFSISVWAKVGSGEGGTSKAAVSLNESANWPNDLLLLYIGDNGGNNSNKGARVYVDGTNNVLNYDESLDDGRWRHYTLIKEGSSLYLYVNSKKVDSGSLSASWSSSQMGIGAVNSSGTWEQYYEGDLSEVRIYDRPLTTSEVQYFYTASQRGRQVTSKKSS